MLSRVKLALVTSALAFVLAFVLASGAGLGSAALACPGHESDKAAKNDAKSATAVPASATTAAFHVTGMHCAGCDSAVRESLAKLNGIYKVDVKMADKRIIVAYDKSKVSAEAITKAIVDAGFQASAEV